MLGYANVCMQLYKCALLVCVHGVQKLSDGPKYSFQLLEFWREEIFIDEIVYIM